MSVAGAPGKRDPATWSTNTYEKLKRAILMGDIVEGEALVESVLAQRFDVSRTPVREALMRLEQDGIIERRDRGLVVRERSPQEILDIYETRIVLEAKAATVAADRRTEFHVMKLRQLVERGRSLDPASSDELAENNRQFHRNVWLASGNESLVDLLERLSLHLMRYPRTTLSYDGRWKSAMDEHGALVDAIEMRDAVEAAKISEHHFSNARDIRIQLWKDEFTD